MNEFGVKVSLTTTNRWVASSSKLSATLTTATP